MRDHISRNNGREIFDFDKKGTIYLPDICILL